MGRAGQPGSQPEIVGPCLYGADAAVARWVSERVEGYSADPDAAALGVVEGERLVAGVVYERFNGIHVEAAIAAEPGTRWATRRSLFHLFHYPFETLGCHAMTVSVASTNLASLNLVTKMGFEPEAIVRFAAHGGADLVVLKMYRETCRWLNYGQEGRRKRTETA